MDYKSMAESIGIPAQTTASQFLKAIGIDDLIKPSYLHSLLRGYGLCPCAFEFNGGNQRPSFLFPSHKVLELIVDGAENLYSPVWIEVGQRLSRLYGNEFQIKDKGAESLEKAYQVLEECLPKLEKSYSLDAFIEGFGLKGIISYSALKDKVYRYGIQSQEKKVHHNCNSIKMYSTKDIIRLVFDYSINGGKSNHISIWHQASRKIVEELEKILKNPDYQNPPTFLIYVDRKKPAPKEAEIKPSFSKELSVEERISEFVSELFLCESVGENNLMRAELILSRFTNSSERKAPAEQNENKLLDLIAEHILNGQLIDSKTALEYLTLDFAKDEKPETLKRAFELMEQNLPFIYDWAKPTEVGKYNPSRLISLSIQPWFNPTFETYIKRVKQLGHQGRFLSDFGGVFLQP